jgi:AAA domain
MSDRELVLTPASEIVPAPVRWAWADNGNGRIPTGALVVAAGREGTGKSSFGVWMAAQVTLGALPGADHGQPRAVIYVAVEDSWRHTLVPRLMAAGADLTRVFRAEVVADELGACTLSLPVDLRRLEVAIAQHDVGLVVLDPLMSMIGEGIDTHRERSVRSALDPLARMADRTGAVVLGIAHFSKAQGADASSLITGSGAFKNVARAIFGFAVDPTAGQSVISQTKNSLGRSDLDSLAYEIATAVVSTPSGPAEVGRLDMLGVADRSVCDILSATGDRDEDEERHDAAAWLRSYLLDNGGEAAAVDIMKASAKVGFSQNTLQRSKRRAKVTSRKSGMDAAWMWVISDEK